MAAAHGYGRFSKLLQVTLEGLAVVLSEVSGSLVWAAHLGGLLVWGEGRGPHLPEEESSVLDTLSSGRCTVCGDADGRVAGPKVGGLVAGSK